MHPTTVSYIAQSFARDREVEAAHERLLAEFHRGQAADGQPVATPSGSPATHPGRVGPVAGIARALGAAFRGGAAARGVARIDGLVFASRAGTALDSRNVTRSFQRALADAGLPRQRFHDLRHAYATLLIEQGEDLGVVSRMLGHADFGTTSDVYAHPTTAMQGRAAERMSTVLRSRLG